jgi:hypothetical protein
LEENEYAGYFIRLNRKEIIFSFLTGFCKSTVFFFATGDCSKQGCWRINVDSSFSISILLDIIFNFMIVIKV